MAEEEGGRIPFLDALRGLAILGILPINAFYFAFPVYVAMEPGHPEPASAASAAAVRAVAALVEGKFHTIFALLFGAGMAILRSRTAESGGRWGPVAVRRMLFLWLLGCAHGVLVWYGDIVAYYALFGLALAWTPGRSPRLLRAWGLVLLALPLLLFAAALAGLLAGVGWITEIAAETTAVPMPDGRVPAWRPGTWEGFAGDLFRFDPDFEAAVYREGSFAQVTALRATTWALASLGIVPLGGPRIAGLFLIGMAWAGEGWLLAPSSGEGRRRFDRMLRRGLLAGVPLTAAGTLLSGLLPRDPAALVAAEIAHYAGSLGMAAAYAALVARAVAARPGAAWVRALAAVGRTAFTNYLVQSFAMTFLFYGSTILLGRGLGLFGELGRIEVLGIAAALGAAQVGASVLWMRHFRAGPFEWTWRAATYLRWSPFRVPEEVSP